VVFDHKVVQISQQTRQVTDGVSVIRPNNRKRLTFVGQDAVAWHIARHGLQDALMYALHLSNGPHSIETLSNIFDEEGCILVRRIGGLDVL
jgi:hypothetical protein